MSIILPPQIETLERSMSSGYCDTVKTDVKKTCIGTLVCQAIESAPYGHDPPARKEQWNHASYPGADPECAHSFAHTEHGIYTHLAV